MALTIDGDVATLTGKLVTASATAAGAPTGSGVTALYTGLVATQLHKVRVSESALTAAATTQDLTLWTLPAGFVLQRVIAEVVTAFAGFTDLDVTVGSSAGGNQFLASFDVDTAAIIAGDVIAEIGAGLTDASRADTTVSANEFATTTLQCRFTGNPENVNAATAGIVDFYIIGYQLPLT